MRQKSQQKSPLQYCTGDFTMKKTFGKKDLWKISLHKLLKTTDINIDKPIR